MLTSTLQREIRRLEITTRHLVTEVFAGDYSSAFRGRGIEFSEIREYQAGDDVRTIDWNVTARNSRPPHDKAFVKRFDEERELTVVLAVDCSASNAFGAGARTKQDIATEIGALLTFAAARKNDKVSLLLFTDRIEVFIPPRKGARHALRILRELVAHQGNVEGRGTDVSAALEHLARIIRRRSVMFIISDFADSAVPFDRPLKILGARHDVIAVEVSDPRELELPPAGLIELRDAESGRRMVVDTSSRRIRKSFAERSGAASRNLKRLLRSSGVDHIRVDNSGTHARQLTRFFREREARR